MDAAEISSQLTRALERAVRDAAGADAALVSVEINMLRPPAAGSVRTRIARRTKTLAFVEAELAGPDDALIATASSVYKIAG